MLPITYKTITGIL
jgi:hypothetical protein